MLYKDRAEDDKNFIKKVCEDFLSAPAEIKKYDDSFAGIFVEGRDRGCCLEDLACLHSFDLHSAYNYPIFCFLHNRNFFKDALSEDEIKRKRIHIIEIPKIESLESYSKFCIEQLYFLLPNWVENVITIQPDAMFLKSGWEEYINNSEADWLSPHWMHLASIEVFGKFTGNRWATLNAPPTQIGNGGFSFRKVSLMKKISSSFWAPDVFLQKERGRADNRIPMEDLFYCFWGFASGIMSPPTLKQCDEFAKDPLTPEIYFSRNKPFGFHFFKEFSLPTTQPCIHLT